MAADTSSTSIGLDAGDDVAATAQALRHAAELCELTGTVPHGAIDAIRAVLSRLTGPDTADSARSAERWTVNLLGRFTVMSDGRDVTPPAGKTATLVTHVAIDGPIRAIELVDRLWPDADEVTGRARLRNTLHRLGVQVGPLVVRHGEWLQLHTEAAVDIERFEQLADDVNAAAPADRPTVAQLALDAYTGDLLHGDDDVELTRQSLRRRHHQIVDLAVEAAIDHDDIDTAIVLLERSVIVDRLDDRHAITLARLAAADGRPRLAARAARFAAETAAELGVEPPADIARLAVGSVPADRCAGHVPCSGRQASFSMNASSWRRLRHS